MGPAGLTVVIAREDLVANKSLKFDITPTLCDWEVCFKNESMYNTPPCYSIYLAGLFFDYIKQKGGLAYVDEQSNLKS
jgi:phosphoserine aminotransferase